MKYAAIILSVLLSGCSALGGVVPWIQLHAPEIAASTVAASAISSYESAVVNGIALERAVTK